MTRSRSLLLLGAIFSVTIGLFFGRHLSSWTGQTTTPPASQLCSPARILYFNLQPSIYSRDGELPEVNEVRQLGFNITFHNRQSASAINKALLQPFNVLWIHSGCAGDTFPLKASELTTIKDFYLKGGSLIIDAGDDKGGGLFGPPESDCQARANQVATNLGVEFSGRVEFPEEANNCQAIQGADSPVLKGVNRIYRQSSGGMKILSTLVWGKTKPQFTGTISDTGNPVLAVIPPEEEHGGVVFSPQDQGFQMKCSGEDGRLYKSIFEYFGHALECVTPTSELRTTPVAGGTCQRVERSLYSSGAVKVPCPQDTVIMGGGWNNGAGELFDVSRPFEVGNGWECQGNTEAVTGVCTAICCDSAIYDSIVTYNAGPLAENQRPLCGNGYSVTGGGFLDATFGKDEDILKPNPDANGWICYDDGSTTVDGSQCFAICAKRKDAQDILSCQTVSSASPQDTAVEILCPADTFVTAGGFEDKSTSNHDQDMSMPLPDGMGWVCQKEGNEKAGPTANICYARCCSLPAGVKNFPPATSSSSLSISSQSLSSQGATSASSVLSSESQSSSVSATTYIPSSEQYSAATAISSVSSVVTSSAQSSAMTSATTSSSSSSSSAQPSSTSPSSSSSSSSSSAPASSAAIAKVSCPANACASGGDGYCAAFNLRCGAIADDPCFVCLASLPGSSQASLQSPSSVSLALDTTQQSNRSSLQSSSSSSIPTSSSQITQTIVLPAALIEQKPQVHASGHSPVGATGPASLAMMAAGAAGGIGWMRRKKRI